MGKMGVRRPAGVPVLAAILAACVPVTVKYSVDVLGARAAGIPAMLLDPAGAWPVDDCPKAATSAMPPA